MDNPKVILVEDDKALAEMLEYRLQSGGYRVRSTLDGDEALAMAREELPDLMILDWVIEGTSGIDVLRRLRSDRSTRDLPIILLTARDGEDDRVHGLETGADDYITKPFSPRELLARASAVLRRGRPAPAAQTVCVGDIRLDPAAHRVERAGAEVKLGPTEYRLLAFFMLHPGRVFSRAQLLEAVWSNAGALGERAVDVHIRRLRKAISRGNAPNPIRTVRLAGYTLEP